MKPRKLLREMTGEINGRGEHQPEVRGEIEEIKMSKRQEKEKKRVKACSHELT